MNKIAIVVLAGPEQGDGAGRIVNALMATKEFKENQDVVQLIFTGIGTKWIPVLANPEHQLHAVYNSIKDTIAGACGFCATAYDVTAAVQSCGIPVLEEFGTNMSFLRLVNEGYTVITF